MTSTENKPAPRELAIDLEEMKAYPLIHAHKDFVCFIEKSAYDQLQKDYEELDSISETNSKISLLHQDKNILLQSELAKVKRELEECNAFKNGFHELKEANEAIRISETRLEAKPAKAVEALKFYAEEDNYWSPRFAGGGIARKTLADIAPEDGE
jgi:hypothetical protein